MARVIRSEQAQLDLEEIFDYLDCQGAEAADRFATKFDAACSLYAKHPQLGASADAYAANLRHFIVWSYAIFYRPTDEGIELIRILHRARDIPKLFE